MYYYFRHPTYIFVDTQNTHTRELPIGMCLPSEAVVLGVLCHKFSYSYIPLLILSGDATHGSLLRIPYQ